MLLDVLPVCVVLKSLLPLPETRNRSNAETTADGAEGIPATCLQDLELSLFHVQETNQSREYLQEYRSTVLAMRSFDSGSGYF